MLGTIHSLDLYGISFEEYENLEIKLFPSFCLKKKFVFLKDKRKKNIFPTEKKMSQSHPFFYESEESAPIMMMPKVNPHYHSLNSDSLISWAPEKVDSLHEPSAWDAYSAKKSGYTGYLFHSGSVRMRQHSRNLLSAKYGKRGLLRSSPYRPLKKPDCHDDEIFGDSSHRRVILEPSLAELFGYGY